MTIKKKWSKATKSKIKRKVPKKGGVYELTSFGKDKPLYIGGTHNLKNRILEHNRKRNPNRYRYKTAGFLNLFPRPQSMEKKHFNKYENKYSEIPPWNTQDPRK